MNCLEEVFSEPAAPRSYVPRMFWGTGASPGPPEHPLLQDAVVGGAFTAEKLPREEGEVVLGYRVQIPAL
jgi:hypothetical protein